MFDGVTDAIGAVSAIAVGGAAVWAAMAAWEGLRTWREETVGRRRADLAEEVLADFYRVRDVIRWARSRNMFVGETDDRPRNKNENEETSARLDELYIPLHRLRAESDFLSSFRSKRYRFQAVFGQDAGELFTQITDIESSIESAAKSEARKAAGRRSPLMDPDIDQRMTNNNEERIWHDSGDDEISIKLDAIVSAVEALCRPAIEARARASAR